MKRQSILLAALVAASFFFYSAPAQGSKTYVGAPWDPPTLGGFPAMFGTTASGTGTATQYLRAIPVTVNATTGAVLVDLSSAAISLNASGVIGVEVNPPSMASTTLYLVGSTPTLITSITLRKNIFITYDPVATEQVYIDVGSSTASITTGIPLYWYYSDEVPASVPISMVASTPTPVRVKQGGD